MFFEIIRKEGLPGCNHLCNFFFVSFRCLISLLFLSFSLFYITREFDRLLHQGGAKNDADPFIESKCNLPISFNCKILLACSHNYCEATRLRSRLISVAYVTSLRCLRQMPILDVNTVVTRMDTPKSGETLKFMYIKYQPI